MILEKQTEASILREGTNEDSIGMSLDLDSAQILMQMLSKNLYSDSIGSTIRECASNALDSHRRTGETKPIIVSFRKNEQDNFEFSVEDFGIGLDADDVRNIISKYGKSTKRNSSTELGMMGLGFKSPLAYSSSFYFVARKDGVERKYMMYEGEDVNTIDLLYEGPTKECNGVKVIVPVQYRDRYEFETKIKEQLAYFESVYFDVMLYSTPMPNDHLIHRAQDFQFSELYADSSMHICLDNVYYPIDFAKLGIDPIYIPIGLRFSINDGLFPTPNRESIRYTQEAKKIILDKIAVVADYFQEKYNASITDKADIQTIFSFYNSKVRMVHLVKEDVNVSELLAYSKIPMKVPSIDGITMLDLKKVSEMKDYILGEYNITYTLINDRMSDQKGYRGSSPNIRLIDDTHYYIHSEKIGGNMKSYIKENVDSSQTHYFVKKIKAFTLFPKSKTGNPYNNYHMILNLSKYPKQDWRQIIKEFQMVVEMFTSKFKDVDSIVIPVKWFEDRKKKQISISKGGTRKVKLQGEVNCKEATDLQRYVQGQSSKFVPMTYKLEDIEKLPTLIVYSKHENNKNLDKLYEITAKQKIKYLTFSDREIKVLEKAEMHNLITYEKFMEGKNKPFKRLVTAYLIDILISKNRHAFGHKDLIAGISSDLTDKLTKLKAYRDKHHISANGDIHKAMLDIAIEGNLFDFDIYHLYQEIDDLFTKLPFINIVMEKVRSWGDKQDPLLPALTDLFKYYRYRLNYTCYKLNNEPITEKLTTI